MLALSLRSPFFFAVAALAALVASCGDDAQSSVDGKACSRVGENACFDNITHLCRFDSATGRQTWQPREDCGASSTPNCECTIIQGTLMECLVDGNASAPVACQGTRLND